MLLSLCLRAQLLGLLVQWMTSKEGGAGGMVLRLRRRNRMRRMGLEVDQRRAFAESAQQRENAVNSLSSFLIYTAEKGAEGGAPAWLGCEQPLGPDARRSCRRVTTLPSL
jgi:hypothetical protein